jgi:hypothetical protein
MRITKCQIFSYTDSFTLPLPNKIFKKEYTWELINVIYLAKHIVLDTLLLINSMQVSVPWTSSCPALIIGPVLEMKIWIYWSKSNSSIYFRYIYLNKNWKIYWSEQSFTELQLEDRCSLWWLSDRNMCIYSTTEPWYIRKEFTQPYLPSPW